MSSNALLRALFLPLIHIMRLSWLYSASIFYCLLIFIAQYSTWSLSYARNPLHIYARFLFFSVSIPRHIVPGFLPDFYNSHAYMCQPLYFPHFNFMLYSARNLYHIKENCMHIYARLLITSILIPCYIMPGFSTILSSL